MQYKEIAGGICAPKGFAAAGVHCGIRANHSEKYDLALIKADVRCAAAGVYTTNKVCGAPIKVDRAHLTDGYAQAIVVNSGNANTCAANGVALAEECCELVGKALNIDAKDVLPSSTGVIGQPMVIDPFARGIPAAAAKLAADAQGSADAATAIMTTDTVQKAFSTKALIDGKLITVTGISKGSGMIEPRMATMLGFIATDAGVAPDVLAKVAKRVADASFNRITVDGDTSTNDSFITIATGQSELSIESEDDPRLEALVGALTIVGQHLAQSMIRDGEGASKFITIQVQGARTESEALQVCYAVAHSPLVKTAFFASDPNLGRILAAVGNARVEDLDANKVNLWLDEVQVARNGGRAAEYKEEDGVRVMAKPEITVRIDLGRGSAQETVWTTDLSHDYVSINADYRS